MSRNGHFYTRFRLSLCLVACILPALAWFEPLFNNSPPPLRGPNRVRVVVVEDAQATAAFKPNAPVVRELLARGITGLLGTSDTAAAWNRLVATQDVIGIKVFSSPGPQIGTRPAVVAALIEELLAARIPTNRIIIWDRQLSDLRTSGFVELAQHYGVRAAGAIDSGWDAKVFYESALLGQLVYGDLEFQKEGAGIGRKSHVSKLLTTEVTKIINVSPLLNHNSIGVCGNLYGLAIGSVDNTIRFEGDSGKLAQAVPEIYALPVLGDRVVLNIVDALVCQYEGERLSRLHNSTELNQLRLSTDPVALDILSLQEIRTQRARARGLATVATNRVELYENAALLELGVADPKKIQVFTDTLSH